jgi:Ras family
LIQFQIAREYGIRFMETSAKANVNIEKAFCELAEAILDQTSGKDSSTDNQERVVVDRKGQDKSPAYKGCCS